MISKDAAVWQCRGLVFLHEPFSSWVISYSDLKNIRGVTSCILVSLHRVLQPTKQATVNCGYQAKVSVASLFSFFFFFTLLCGIFWYMWSATDCCPAGNLLFSAQINQLSYSVVAGMSVCEFHGLVTGAPCQAQTAREGRTLSVGSIM